MGSGNTADRRSSDQPAGRAPITLAVLLVTAGAALVFGLCGGAFYYFQPHVNDDPSAVAPLLSDVLAIDVPTEGPVQFQPRGTIEWNLAFLMTMRGAYFETVDEAQDGVLMVLEVSGSALRKPDVRSHVERVLRERQEGGIELVPEGETEERMISIRNEEIPFTFALARDPASQRKYRLIHGIIPAADREVLIALRIVNEPPWDDALAVEMLQSIH